MDVGYFWHCNWRVNDQHNNDDNDDKNNYEVNDEDYDDEYDIDDDDGEIVISSLLRLWLWIFSGQKVHKLLYLSI